MTTIANIEKSIERHKKRSIGRIPQNFDELHICSKNENWKQFLNIDADSFLIEFVIKNNVTKIIIFIDKTLCNFITNSSNEKLLLLMKTYTINENHFC